MDAAEHYRQLLQLGRDEFLAAAAPAALVRHRAETTDAATSSVTARSIDEEIEETLPLALEALPPLDVEVYPLTKKPGAAYPDRITIGRTSNNDVTIPDPSVSRLHAYIRRTADGWLVADAGSKNGSRLRGVALEPRRETPMTSRATLRLGDVELTFYLAADLYAELGGNP